MKNKIYNRKYAVTSGRKISEGKKEVNLNEKSRKIKGREMKGKR
jgi:hypothetical protein